MLRVLDLLMLKIAKNTLFPFQNVKSLILRKLAEMIPIRIAFCTTFLPMKFSVFLTERPFLATPPVWSLFLAWQAPKLVFVDFWLYL